MILGRTNVLTDNHGKELIENDLQLFNLRAIESDIHQYAMGYIPSHWHKELEIFVLLEGHVNVQIENCTYELHAGDGCFINSEVIHTFTAASSLTCHFRSFVFGSEIITGIPGTVFDMNYVRPILESETTFIRFEQNQDDTYFTEFSSAFDACAEEYEGYEFAVRTALSNILLYIKDKKISNVARTIPSVQEQRLKNMLQWIETHLADDLSVSEIAKSANICTRECQRIFHQYLHYSPIEYILQKRIFQAVELLSYTDKSITEIALLCGFSNPSYFTKRFREYVGSTPKEYRSTFQKNISYVKI